jgi:hypothetical protein
VVNNSGSRPGNNNIIDVDQHNDPNTIVLENEERRIRLGRNKTNLREAITDPRIPCLRGLLQAVKKALQLANMGWIPRVFKTGQLLHVDILRQKTMEKRIAHINLTERPPMGEINGENQANGSRLHNWTKVEIIVNTVLLGEATSNETSLVLLNKTIRTMLGFKN